MTKPSPRISIGLPTYNRPELLEVALDSFRAQTFTDFELIISDNASPNPKVQWLCERYVEQDSRFRYVRQLANQGAESNFWFVFDQARAPLFMWASDDDLWPAEFLEKGVAALDVHPHASAWFCQVVNINIHGAVVRSYPSFGRFQSSALKFIDLARFLWEPEIMGKANLIYSIFRRQDLSKVISIFRQRPSIWQAWGSDMNLVYGFLCRSDLLVDDGVLLQKRVPTETVAQVDDPRALVLPPEWHQIYFRNYRLAAKGSGYRPFTASVLAARAAYDYWYTGRARRDYDNWPLRRQIVRVLWRIWARLGTLASVGKE